MIAPKSLNNISSTKAIIDAQYKTASYSFTSPLTIGAVLAGAPESELELLRELSQKLGVGYQMRDDILGVFGDEAKTGKSASTDITEGKRTFLIEQFEMLATPAQSQRFLQIFHRPDATEQELEEARDCLSRQARKARSSSKSTAFVTLRTNSLRSFA